MPTTERSRFAVPEGWKCVERIESETAGTRKASPAGSGIGVGANGPATEAATIAAAAEIALAPAAAGVAFERESFEAGLLARLAGGVDEEEAVVDDRRGAGAKFDGANPFVFGEAERNCEVVIEVGTVAGTSNSSLISTIRSGWPSCQPGVNSGVGGRSAGVGPGHVGVDPGLEQRDLLVGEAAFAMVGDGNRLGMPRRHVPREAVTAVTRSARFFTSL